MADMESILSSIRKMLGPEDTYTYFDSDIIMHINSALADLGSIGVGPEEGFEIEDESATWEEFFGEFPNPKLLNNVKQYVYLSVKLIFDPPSNSTVLNSYETKLTKLEWKINALVDPGPKEV